MKLFENLNHQREIFRRFGRSLQIDASHKTMRKNYILVTGLVQGGFGEGIPIFHSFAPTEDSEITKESFQTLKELEPEAFEKIEYLVGDMSRVHLKAWREATKDINGQPQPIKAVSCNWHFVHRYPEWQLADDAKAIVEQMRTAPNQETFRSLYSTFELDFGDTPGGITFLNNYGDDGNISKPSMWSQAFNDKGNVHHNIHLEAFHSVIKRSVTGKTRMDALVQELLDHDDQSLRNEANRTHDRKNMDKTRAQLRQAKEHPKDDSHYFLTADSDTDPTKELWTIFNSNNNSSYKLEVLDKTSKVCNDNLCGLYCKQCGNSNYCYHSIVCQCPRYIWQMHCKHVHVLASWLKNNEGGTRQLSQPPKLVHKHPLDDFKQKSQIIGPETTEQNVLSKLSSYMQLLKYKARSEIKDEFMKKLEGLLEDIQVPAEIYQSDDKRKTAMKVIIVSISNLDLRMIWYLSRSF